MLESRMAIADLLKTYCIEAEQESNTNADEIGARVARVEYRAAERFATGARISPNLRWICRKMASTWEVENAVHIPENLLN